MLNISLIQTDLHWQKPEANRAMLEEKIWQIKQATDLIILPEMFTTGFTMHAQELAEPTNLTTHKWLAQQASQTQALVMGSYIVSENGKFFNRMVLMKPDGTYTTYDKRHLFRMGDEDKVFTAGTTQSIIAWKGWKIMPLICYDLRFPVWSRNVALQYDLLVYVANWPQVRAHAWTSMLTCRAIENLAYTIGVNRVGTDGTGKDYSGNSAIFDFMGNQIISHDDGIEAISTHSLDKKALENYRNSFPAYKDSDNFEIII